MKKIYASLMAVVLLFSVQGSFAQATNGKKNPLDVNSLRHITMMPGVTTTTSANNSLMKPVRTLSNGLSSDRCGFVTQQNKMLAAGYDKAAFERIINAKVAEIKAARLAGRATVNYTIPVIFHIIHDGTAEGVGANVSAAQVNQQISQLNKDFGNQSGSPFFVAAATGISFCAVTVDPNGIPLTQPGIERINRITKGWIDPTQITDPGDGSGIDALINYVDAVIKPVTIWDPARYVNIWAYDFSNSGLLGYATFPTAGLPGLPAGETATTAGAVFLSGSLGSVTSPGPIGEYGLGRTITHELGHFFGLYHIWGDVDDCSGTDECADTPPCSADYYSQVNTGCVIPVQCSSQPRMIQNYMDYSDDGCMNTYTQNQADRIQAVMLAAPRRPFGSTVCPVLTSNALNFTTASSIVTETGTGVGCNRFKDIVLSVKPVVAATGNATVTFTLGGTATLNSDYSIVSGATQAYTSGDGAAKNITIRIFDDATIESTETIVLGYTISGTGLVTGTYPSYTLSITDNDFAQDINNTTTTTTLLSQNFGTTTGSNQVPVNWTTSPTTGTNKWVGNSIGAAALGFTGNTMHISNGNATAINNGTAALNYNTNVSTDARLITPTLAAAGLKNITANFNFVCNGEIFDGTVYDAGIVYYSLDGGTNYSAATDINGNFILQGITTKTNLTVYLPAGTIGTNNMKFMFRWISDDQDGNQPPFIADDILITGQSATVETQATHAGSEIIPAGAVTSVIYSANDGQIIAKIANASTAIGCVNASVNQAGTSTLVTLTTSAGSYQRSSKVTWLTPSTSNTTATYQATFYYTTAEVSNWPNPLTLKIMKVKDGVDVFGTIGGADAALFTPTVDDQRAAKGYIAYTINATGGFSQFLLVSPLTALPVLSLDFTARAAKTNIVLNWSTTSELNNKGFAIERSKDGVTYEKISWQDGAINSSSLTRYSFIDNFVQPDVLYYYRLRQTDLDGRGVLSDIRQAKIKGSGISVTLSPNPASDQVKIFVACGAGASDVRLFNAEGQLVRIWKKQNLGTPTTLDITGLAKGMYIFNIITGGETKVEKLIIN